MHKTLLFTYVKKLESISAELRVSANVQQSESQASGNYNHVTALSLYWSLFVIC